MEIRKLDEDLQIVYGEVYAPSGVPDSQGDVMSAEAIRKMAHKFLVDMRVDQIDVNHDHDLTGAHVVESFIARKDDEHFIEDSWVVGVHVPDPTLWKRIKSGDLNGFSMEASVIARKVKLEVEIPAEVLGETMVSDGHKHRFVVFFDEDGNFLGGRTTDDEKVGHGHQILNGTTTEPADGNPGEHVHRFSFLEFMLDALDVLNGMEVEEAA